MLHSIANTDMAKAPDNRGSQLNGKQPAIPPHTVRMPEDKVSLQEKSADVTTYAIPSKAAFKASDYITLREMIVNILKEQGITTRIAFGDTLIDFKDLTPKKAQGLIAEDGYFGVEQTSDRIVQFAISLSGNDPSKLEEIRAGIEKGFQMAAKALGGTLPDISMKTYNAVMEKFDAWAEGLDAA